MSDTDSFIDEVSEEVRRDKLYGAMRKYGWIGVVGVVALVAGAAWSEYQKSQNQASAQAAGDALIEALDEEDSAARANALADAALSGEMRVLGDLLQAGELMSAGNVDAALAVLAPWTNDAFLTPEMRDLAVLKTAMIGAEITEPEDRIAQLAQIASAGAPYRLLAEEQIATAQIEMGDTDAALQGFRAIVDDADTGDALRRRANQMIVALGGDPLAE